MFWIFLKYLNKCHKQIKKRSISCCSKMFSNASVGKIRQTHSTTIRLLIRTFTWGGAAGPELQIKIHNTQVFMKCYNMYPSVISIVSVVLWTIITFSIKTLFVQVVMNKQQQNSCSPLNLTVRRDVCFINLWLITHIITCINRFQTVQIWFLTLLPHQGVSLFFVLCLLFLCSRK